MRFIIIIIIIIIVIINLVVINSSHPQHKTELGKGRCFIRMALAAKQLAEAIQVASNVEAV